MHKDERKASPSGLIQEKKDKSKEDEASGHSDKFVQKRVKEKKRKGSPEKKAEGLEMKSRYAPKASGIKRPYRYRPGVVALREIRRALTY